MLHAISAAPCCPVIDMCCITGSGWADARSALTGDVVDTVPDALGIEFAADGASLAYTVPDAADRPHQVASLLPSIPPVYVLQHMPVLGSQTQPCPHEILPCPMVCRLSRMKKWHDICGGCRSDCAGLGTAQAAVSA